ncbi:MAG: hypothetical protein F6K30_13370 [Cyanothece sp. SIO2G6]|nr:hypothetical protein [Cyanothece sp. SIO2G6]
MTFLSRWFAYGLVCMGLGLGSCQTTAPQSSKPDTPAIASATTPTATATAEPLVVAQALSATDDDPEISGVGLAQHLTRIGARMYGAYWCPHCQTQKDLFGSGVSELDYVECDADGENPRPQLCIRPVRKLE